MSNDPPTKEEINFVLEQAQYGYESHLDWENYFRNHICKGINCDICGQMKLLGDADFHAEQRKRYEIELKILRWVTNTLLLCCMITLF